MNQPEQFYEDRETGWLVTKEYAPPNGVSESRVGYGQMIVHAKETGRSFDQLAGRTVFMGKTFTEHMIPEEYKIRWRSFYDDDEPCYDGLVRVDWLMANPKHAEDDLAYNIDRFNMTDTGAVHVYYSAVDIVKAARKFSEPSWERFATDHRHKVINDEAWIEIYG